jgi:hypothetical protein
MDAKQFKPFQINPRKLSAKLADIPEERLNFQVTECVSILVKVCENAGARAWHASRLLITLTLWRSLSEVLELSGP